MIINMKKRMLGLVLVMLVLAGSLVAAGSSSGIKKTFVVSDGAISEKAVFLTPEEVAAMGRAEAWDVLIVVAGLIAIVVVLYLIIKKWIKKKPRARRKKRKKKRGNK